MTHLKCPKCQFVNFPDANVCKKCASSFYTAPEQSAEAQNSAVSVKKKPPQKKLSQTNQEQTTPEQTKPAVLVKLAPKKNAIVSKIIWTGVLVACILSAIQIYYALKETNSPKQIASFALAFATAILPYFCARAIDELEL